MLKSFDEKQIVKKIEEDIHCRDSKLHEEKCCQMAIRVGSRLRDNLMGCSVEIRQLPALIRHMQGYLRKSGLERDSIEELSMELVGYNDKAKELVRVLVSATRVLDRLVADLEDYEDDLDELLTRGQ